MIKSLPPKKEKKYSLVFWLVALLRELLRLLVSSGTACETPPPPTMQILFQGIILPFLDFIHIEEVRVGVEPCFLTTEFPFREGPRKKGGITGEPLSPAP